MKAGAHTHRDTLGFVLAIVGAMGWSVFPVGGLIFGHGNEDSTVGLLAIAIVGALIGAWSGASVWRHVSPVTAAVAGGIAMAALVGVSDLMKHQRHHHYYEERHIAFDAISVDTIDIGMIAVVALAAYGGAVLGRRNTIPRVALTAAWIMAGFIAIVGAAIAILEISGVHTDDWAWPVIFLTPLVGGLVAAAFCHVRPGAIAGRLFGLSVSAFVLLIVLTPSLASRESGDLFAASTAVGLFLAMYGALAALVGHAIRQRLRYEPPLPPAQIVER